MNEQPQKPQNDNFLGDLVIDTGLMAVAASLAPLAQATPLSGLANFLFLAVFTLIVLKLILRVMAWAIAIKRKGQRKEE